MKYHCNDRIFVSYHHQCELRQRVYKQAAKQLKYRFDMKLREELVVELYNDMHK
jgi:hypothetical protein